MTVRVVRTILSGKIHADNDARVFVRIGERDMVWIDSRVQDRDADSGAIERVARPGRILLRANRVCTGSARYVTLRSQLSIQRDKLDVSARCKRFDGAGGQADGPGIEVGIRARHGATAV